MSSQEDALNLEALREDVVKIAGNLTLALRSVSIALLSIKLDDSDKLLKNVDDLDKYADEVWQIFQKHTGVDDHGE